MATRRLAAQVESIDPATLDTDPDDARALLGLTAAMTAARLKNRADHATIEDAAQVAALLACSLLATWPADPDRLSAVAALATYRACLAALEDAGTSKEDAADTLATDDTGQPLIRLALPVTVDPARSARTTDRDRAEHAWAMVRLYDPAAADLIALATYLPADDGRAWRDGLPSAAPMVAALGLKATGRNRSAVARKISSAFDQATEAGTWTLALLATRRHYGATDEVWTAHRQQVEHPATDGPAPLTPGTWGASVLTTAAKSKPSNQTRRYGRIGYLPTGEPYAGHYPWQPSTEPSQTVGRHAGTLPTYRTEQTPTGRATRIGQEITTPRSGPASAVIHTDTTTGDRWLQVTPGPMATLLPLPADLDPAWVLAHPDTLPAYRRSTDDAASDGMVAAAEPLGPVAKANPRKRRRDGALGAPTTTGRSTRPRW